MPIQASTALLIVAVALALPAASRVFLYRPISGSPRQHAGARRDDAEGCALRYNEFPHRRDCQDYCREPGADDE